LSLGWSEEEGRTRGRVRRHPGGSSLHSRCHVQIHGVASSISGQRRSPAHRRSGEEALATTPRLGC
jgi:hypothetical protein